MKLVPQYEVTFATTATTFVVSVAHPHDSDDNPIASDEDLRDIMIECARDIIKDDLGFDITDFAQHVWVRDGRREVK